MSARSSSAAELQHAQEMTEEQLLTELSAALPPAEAAAFERAALAGAQNITRTAAEGIAPSPLGGGAGALRGGRSPESRAS